MYEATVTVKLKCPDHPEFNPEQDYTPKGCKCCAAIAFVKGWLFLAERKSDQITSGFYKRKAGQVVEDTEVKAFSIEDVADVASSTPSSKEAPEDEAVLVQESREPEARMVRRKVVGGGRMKVKSAPQKPKFQSQGLL